MKNERISYSVYGMEGSKNRPYFVFSRRTPYTIRHTSGGFTLIETLVAISILVIAVVAPMSLAAQSLSSAFYARDQITASHLAQEGIEVIRARRDANALAIAHGSSVDLLSGIDIDQDLIVDTHDGSITKCSDLGLPGNACPPLQNNGQFYGYGSAGLGWNTTRFTRVVHTSNVNANEEIKVRVTVSWQTGVFQARSFTISENLYRWVETGSAS